MPMVAESDLGSTTLGGNRACASVSRVSAFRSTHQVRSRKLDRCWGRSLLVRSTRAARTAADAREHRSRTLLTRNKESPPRLR
jgi:hypothetical protein